MIEWTWDKPTEPGLYLAMYGDVETPENAALIHVMNGILNDPSCRIDGEICRVSDLSKSLKFWKVPL